MGKSYPGSTGFESRNGWVMENSWGLAVGDQERSTEAIGEGAASVSGS